MKMYPLLLTKIKIPSGIMIRSFPYRRYSLQNLLILLAKNRNDGPDQSVKMCVLPWAFGAQIYNKTHCPTW